MTTLFEYHHPEQATLELFLDGNVRFVIHHKTGRDVRKLSQYESEGEVLLGSPTKYKVGTIKDLTTKKGYVEIHLEEITNE